MNNEYEVIKTMKELVYSIEKICYIIDSLENRIKELEEIEEEHKKENGILRKEINDLKLEIIYLEGESHIPRID